jgi:hypothetical protein
VSKEKKGITFPFSFSFLQAFQNYSYLVTMLQGISNRWRC